MKTLLIPLDDRPVTYTFPALVARVARVEAILPPRQLMGALTRPAQIEGLLSFAEGVIAKQEPDSVIVSLDSILYGGLITGRRSADDFKTIMARVERIKKWKTLSSRPPKIMAQSSIMRISDNYDNTEEKEYWSRFGREIFEWSACLHRLSNGEKLATGLLESLERRIPADIRKDYLDTRRRNFSINMALLKSMNEKIDDSHEGGYLDYLIFSQDDSGTHGLNVSEKERLIATSKQLGVTDKVSIYAGADEVLMTLLARLLISEGSGKDNINAPGAIVYFSPAGSSGIGSRYEGQDIGTTVTGHVEATGLRMTAGVAAGSPATTGGEGKPFGENTFALIVHGPSEVQGDHITLPGLADLSQINTSQTVAETLDLIERAPAMVILADVAYANGGDPKLVEALLNRRDLLAKVISYGGWNTTGNTMGSTLAAAVSYWFSQLDHNGSDSAETRGSSDSMETAPHRSDAPLDATAQATLVKAPLSEAHKQCLFVRLLDDWAYQACVRKLLLGDPSTQKLATLIGPYIAQLNKTLEIEPNIRLSFPWKRTFEIEIGFEGC